MAKQGQRAEVNTFIQGLITEASPLNFPPNASKLEENFELYRDGTRQRRLGMDYELNYALIPADAAVGNFPPVPRINTYNWDSVAGDAATNFIVAKVGTQFHFFNSDNDGALTTTGYKGTLTVPIVNYDEPCSFCAVDGILVIACNQVDVVLVEYNLDTEVFTYEYARIKVRDVWGVEVPDASVENDPLYQPEEASDQHLYNLMNQSWGLVRRANIGLTNPIDIYFNEYDVYPSNSEVVWSGLQYQPVEAGADPFERIYPNLYKEVFGLNVPAAKGFFIIDALDRGLSRTAEVAANALRPTGATNLVDFVTNDDRVREGGVTVVAEYAGRVFFTGIPGETLEPDRRSPNLSNYVFFSQLVRNKKDIGKCYQEGDPTSRDGSDVVDTDGGFIKISGANNILSLQNIGSHLIVLADNGVWAISGGGDYGFTATNYKREQVSSFGCCSANSVVLQGDAVLYWGDGGIYVVSKTELGGLKVDSLTKTTIQRKYDSFSLDVKKSAKGIYDEITKKVRWIYRTGDIFSPTSESFELVLNFDIGAFSLNRIQRINENSVEILQPLNRNTGITYLTLVKTTNPYSITFSEYRNTDFLDFYSYDNVGVDAKAFLWTGDQVAGDSAVFKQAPYIVIHMRKTETVADNEGVPLNQSSCKFSAYWDWASSTLSNKVSNFQQAYRYRKPLFAEPLATYDNGFAVVSSKNKIRGRGRALSLYMETEPGKDCQLVGWNITLNGNQVA